MAEVAIVGIVSNIVQLVEFTSKVVIRLNEFHSSTSEVPNSSRQITSQLPLLLRTLDQIKESIDSGSFDAKCAAALLPIVKECEEQIKELDDILSRLLPKQGDSRTKKTLKSLNSVFQDRKINEVRKRLQKQVGMFTFYFAASSSIHQPPTEIELRKIHQWLLPPDPSINYLKALKLRQANTGLWLLQSDLYNRWITEASSFWLHGIPGCGKTIISATVLEDVLQRTADDPGKAVAYFYFDFNDQQKLDPGSMVRSLICQLLQQCIKKSSSIYEVYTSCEKGQRQPSHDALLTVLQELVEDFPQVYIIIDALDECTRRKELMKVLQEISNWQLTRLHVLLTSRREGDILDSLEQVVDNGNMLSLADDAIDQDIQLYVHERLQNDRALRKWAKPELRQEIESSLMKGARGMFRWVVCQLDILGECRSRRQLRENLANLPPTLDETYNRILNAIKGPDVEYATRILRWLSFSTKPLFLEDIAEIAAIDLDRQPAFDRDDVLEDPLEICSICLSLVSVSPPISYEGVVLSRDVSLAHYSVKEYLMSDRIRKSSMANYAMEASMCHRFIAKCCLKYLQQFDKAKVWNRDDMRRFVLADYSASQWMTHMKSNTEEEQEMTDLILRFLTENKEIYLNWILIKNFWKVSYGKPKNPQPLYFACQAGLYDVTKRLILEMDADVNGPGEDHWNALHVASYEGHETIVQLLLDNGADVNARGESTGNALQAASRNGHEKIVQLLLKNGIDVNVQGGAFGNALQAASHNGHETVVQQLLENGADVNAQGDFGNALLAASRKGHEKIVQQLLENGADSKARSEKNETALREASGHAHEKIIQLLLNNGADDFNGALIPASVKGHKEIVQLMLERGADDFNTALVGASIGGHEQIVQLMLDRGANDFNRALIRASENGHKKIVQLMLDRGANDFNRALIDASHSGHEKVVQLLLDRGADDYNNALRLAACRGRNKNIVQLLLEKGANNYNDALKAATDYTYGDTEIVQLLLDKGADNYNNALISAASWRRNKDIVQLLLDKGANDYNSALKAAASIYLNEDIVQLLLEKGGEDCSEGIEAALRGGYEKIVRLVLKEGGDQNP